MGRKRKDEGCVEAAAAGLATQTASTPEPKRKRSKKTNKADAVEKRVDHTGRSVRYSAVPSQKTRDRIARALPGSGHRMFLLNRKTVAALGSEGGPVEEFVVLGATANVYSVRVGRFPYCSCPDAAKGNVCKHYLYVMIRVLRLKQDDPLVWQKALLTSESEEVLSGSRSTRTEEGVMANAAVQMAYMRMCGESTEEAAADAAAPASGRPIEGDCPICYDDLVPGGTTPQTRAVTCQTCGNHVHEECFKAWVAQKRSSHQAVTCVYCRSAWPDATSAAAAATDGDYINLKDISADHRTADTSLYGLYGDNARWIGRRR